MNIKKTIFLMLFFLSAFTKSFSFEISQADSLIKNLRDTSLTSLQNCRPGYGIFFYNQTLGNLGSAFRSQFFFDASLEFYNTGLNQFKVYEYSEEMNKFLVNRIFTRLSYVNGSKKEQNFSIKHCQKLSKNFSFGLDFRSVNSLGFYNKQNASIRNFNIYTLFLSSNKKYSLLLNYLSNRIISQENGGLVNDTAFENTSSFDSKTAVVNFDNVQNRHKSKTFYLEQSFNFLNTKNDSSLKDMKHKEISLSHTFKYYEKSVLFTTDRFYSDFFENAYYDTTSTYDSLFMKTFYNEISLNVENFLGINKFLKGGKSLFHVGINHEAFHYSQRGLDTALYNGVLSAGMSFERDNFKADIYMQQSLNNVEKTSSEEINYYRIKSNIYIKAKHNLMYKLTLEKEMRKPEFIYTYYNSNHFIWFNQFNPVDFSKIELSAEAKFSKQSLRITADLFSIKDLTYFNEEALPTQFSSRVNFMFIDLYHSIKLGKFNLINDLRISDVIGTGQHADKKDVVRLPLFSSYTSFFYERDFFKKALYAEFGFDLRYCTKYFADAYMPSTGQFFLQDKKEIGNYPYLDLFTNFRVQRVRFFLKLEHLNAGFLSRTYYTVPHYPMPGRVFKFGIVWDFFD